MVLDPFNATVVANAIMNFSTQSDLITYQAKTFQPSIIAYFLIQLIITSILGLILVKKDFEKFWMIFIFTFLIGGIVLFFTFFFPILPQFLEKILSDII